MTTEWTLLETSTHQDHIIAHVIGATALGYFKAEEALRLFLDMGFIWTIFVDGEMALLQSGLAVRELSLNAEEKARLLSDIQLLEMEGREAHGLCRIEPAPVECLIEEVEFYGADERRRLLIKGEDASLAVETSLLTGEMSVNAVPSAR
ncbi:MAG: hypothetical protein WBP93_13720 [Pyrinomonadaceae bacterium]